MDVTFEEHTHEVQALLQKASISKRSMLTKEQIYNCYRLLEDEDWEFMAPDLVRVAIMGGCPIASEVEEPDEWEAKQLDRGTGLVCPDCEGKLIVNFDALDDKEIVACPYCDTSSALPEEPE